MTATQPTPALGRRRFLQATAVLAAGTAGLAATGRASAQAGDFQAWFENVSNYDGVVDERGASQVTVAVGAPGNGGGFAFEPAAVRVDPGTTVLWEWTGEGGMHNVSAETDDYESDLTDDPSATFEHEFDADGVSRYACTPHESMGMKGAVVVGGVDVGAAEPEPTYVDREPTYGDWFENTPNFAGTVDARGREEVRIEVGRSADGDPAFSPAAVHVDPGTRVVWDWTGDASHTIVAADGDYESPERDAGSWGLTFDGTGISKYSSSAAGETMRGAVVVGDVFRSVHDVTTTQLTVLGALGAALLSPLAFAAFLWTRDLEESPEQERRRLANERL